MSNDFLNMPEGAALNEDDLQNVAGGKMQAESLVFTDKTKKGLTMGTTLYSGGHEKAEDLVLKEGLTPNASKGKTIHVTEGPLMC